MTFKENVLLFLITFFGLAIPIVILMYVQSRRFSKKRGKKRKMKIFFFRLKIGIFKLIKKCICTKVCDCQNPPPNDWDGKDGVWHMSEQCPIHNFHPDPNPECTAHL